MSKEWKRGMRVRVTDLRTGQVHYGRIIKVPPKNSTYMNVKYDNGSVVRVGEGFVHVADDQNDPGTSSISSLL